MYLKFTIADGRLLEVEIVRGGQMAYKSLLDRGTEQKSLVQEAEIKQIIKFQECKLLNLCLI